MTCWPVRLISTLTRLLASEIKPSFDERLETSQKWRSQFEPAPFEIFKGSF